MKLIKQPNRWSCFPTSLAMVLNCELDYIIRSLGHDGSMIVNPTAPEPLNRRAFHPQELQDFLWRHNYFWSEWQVNPALDIGDNLQPLRIYTDEERNKILSNLLSSHKAILVGDSPYNGYLHAVAWNRKLIYDPNGMRYPIEEFPIKNFYIIGRRA